MKINIYVESRFGTQIHCESLATETAAEVVIRDFESKGFKQISMPFKPELGENHVFLVPDTAS